MTNSPKLLYVSALQYSLGLTGADEAIASLLHNNTEWQLNVYGNLFAANRIASVRDDRGFVFAGHFSERPPRNWAAIDLFVIPIARDADKDETGIARYDFSTCLINSVPIIVSDWFLPDWPALRVETRKEYVGKTENIVSTASTYWYLRIRHAMHTLAIQREAAKSAANWFTQNILTT